MCRPRIEFVSLDAQSINTILVVPDADVQQVLHQEETRHFLVRMLEVESLVLQVRITTELL
jgi:hypothetical protein